MFGREELAPIHFLSLGDCIGTLYALELFLATGNKLFKVDNVKDLPAIKLEIDMLKTHVESICGAEEPSILAPEGLSLLLYRLAYYLYFRKCIELKVPLYRDEIEACSELKNALMYVPAPNHAYSEQVNLIFSIVLVTKEIIELPNSLANVQIPKIQEYLMAAQVILLVAATNSKQSRGNPTLYDVIQRGLSCMLKGFTSSGSAMDEYAQTLANIAYAKLTAWCESIKERRKHITVQGLDSLMHYEEALVTLCGCFNVADDMPLQQEIKVQLKRYLPFDQQDTAACEAFYLELIDKCTKRCAKLEKAVLAIIHERSLGSQSSMTWQRLLTNALNIFYTQLFMARMYLQAGFARFSSQETALRVEHELNVLSSIYSTLIIDAIPRGQEQLYDFNRLWLLIEVARDHSNADLDHIIEFGTKSEVMASMVSTWLVAKVTSHLSSEKEAFKAGRKSIFVNLLDKLQYVIKLADRYTGAKKKLVYQIVADFYYYLLKFSATAEENSMVMENDLLAQVTALKDKTNHPNKYKFLFDLIKSLKSEGKTASDMNERFAAELAKKDEKTYKSLLKLFANECRVLDVYDNHRMNYHVNIEFIMFGAIFISHAIKSMGVVSVKLSNFRRDLAENSYQLIRELGIEAGEICCVGVEIADAFAVPKPPVVVKKPVDPKQIERNRESFLAGTVTTKTSAPRRTAKKSNVKQQREVHDEVVTIKSLPPRVYNDFSVFEDFFNKDYQAIAAYLTSQMTVPKMTAVDKYSALVKMTLCLEQLNDAELAQYIQNNADMFFQDAKKFFSDREEFNSDRAYVYGVLAKLEQEEQQDKDDSSSNTISETAEDDTEESEAEKLTSSVTNVPATMYAQASTVRLVKRQGNVDLQQMLDSARPTEQKNPLKFPITAGQWVILNRLKECQHRTFVHGSSVISLAAEDAYGIKIEVTDIDFMCYVDSKLLQIYFQEHAEELGISWTTQDINDKARLFVYLKEKKPNGDPVKMELLCRGKLFKAAMVRDMKNQQRSFWFSSMLADPYNGSMIDFFNQYRWLITRRKITSVTREPTPSAKFDDSPIGIVKLIARVAYFNSRGFTLKATYALRTGVIVQGDRLAFNECTPDTTINTVDWEKLFLRCHAKQTFDELMFYDVFRIIFPAFDKMNGEQMQSVGKLFAEFDDYIRAKYPFELTEQQYAEERQELLTRLVICHFEITKCKAKLCKNIEALKEKIKFVLTGINLMQMDKIKHPIKLRVMTRLLNLDLKQANAGASALYVPEASYQFGKK